jgi:23S rRNA (adenine2503-C2)-methyltransferase
MPKKLKTFLADFTVPGIYKPLASEVSGDSTVKYLFKNAEGHKFETVYIPDNKRITLCVSTQSGCRMGCPFCMTGKYGYYGNLSAGDIVNQIISVPSSDKITHVVFMGMGEPLAVSPRNVTVSSVGITPGIKEFLQRSACNLTISLYSPFPDEREKVVPVEKAYPVREIIEIMSHYPVRRKRRLSLAYVMISEVNDTDRHLVELITMLKGSGIRVNLLPYHPVKDDLNRSSSEGRMLYFKHKLVISGVSSSVRKSRGIDISAACGLLASGLKHI